MLLIHLVCLAISCGIVCSCKCPNSSCTNWGIVCSCKRSNPDCLCDGREGRRCDLGCGDCDVDEDCMEDLVCGTNNCRAMNRKAKKYKNYGLYDDCCEERQNMDNGK
eukprot:GFUD01109342.1.p1 GENE.GFUD01109342.1~~GFUD01109342.1.p1  ORF type:complete len:107 (-),score=1.85 GFUD01109342.1:57-377(-)